jgi:hypothetical protein
LHVKQPQADNLAEHYGIDDEGALELRRMLRGEISIGEWQDWKANRQPRSLYFTAGLKACTTTKRTTATAMTAVVRIHGLLGSP